MDAPAGSLIAYATSPGSVTTDGIGSNGLYTSKLLEHMLKPGIEIEEVFKKVRISVMNATDKKQIPWESSSLIGNFSFISESANNIPSSKAELTIKEALNDYYFLIEKNNRPKYKKISNRFTIEAKNTVYDSFLQKKWKIIEGEEIFSLEEAKKYCNSMLDGYRLPTEFELKSLITKRRNKQFGVKLATDFFLINSRTTNYWTGTCGSWGAYIYIDFKKGISRQMSKTNYCNLLAISK